MSETQYDVVVIGGGPGGYVCAIRAAQLGMKVACVEKRGALGGTCLNVGCIPSKAMLHSSEKFAEAQHELADHGVEVGTPKLNLDTMLKRKDKVVKDLTGGIEHLFKKNKIDYVKAAGRIQDAHTVATDDGKTLTTKNIVIATGSTHAEIPNVAIDEERIVSSTGALSLPKVPKHLIVIGGGYIGLEMGAVWHRLGAEVTVVEFLDRLLPGMDSELGTAFHKFLKKQGFKFRLGTKVTGAETLKTKVKLTVEPASGGESETLEADNVLLAVGRKPYTEGLGAAEAGVTMTDRGVIEVDDQFRTSVPNIYAIGDVIPGPMLAHKAEEEGVAVAEILAGQHGHVRYDTCPGIVYTWPEIATVGKSEDDLKAAGVDYKVGKFPMMANSRARANGFTEGFVKILADAKTDRVLGAVVMGAEAGNTIHEIVAAMEYGASAEDIARTFHGHPTLNEAVKEAALAVHGKPIHV
jgi:dihydrolipoamide dehydrogenase